MPRKKWIDKHSAQTFQLLHRPQTDPSIYDETLPDRILYQVSGSSSSFPADRALHIADLEDELDYEDVRENEGEAANYGIYYDDSQYDYMQHLRDLGAEGGDAHFMDAAPVTVKGKGKAKTMKLEDALREMDLDSNTRSSQSNLGFLGDEEGSQAPSLVKDRTLEAQQDVPDEIAGFQPDMDPRLREALEALEDDAYVDEKDEDGMFESLVQGGPDTEVDLEDFEAIFEDDDEGWESDRTEKPPDRPPLQAALDLMPDADTADQPDLSIGNLASSTATAAASEDGAWLVEFAKFKRASASTKPQPPQPTAPSTATGPAHSTLYTLNGTPLRKKRRKGALTNPSAYSMTSASLARTEAQQVLDARFDRVAELYALDEEGDDFDDEEDGGVSVISGASKMSMASQASVVSTKSFADEGAVRSDLEGMMDGFLEGWERGGGKIGGPGDGGGGKKKGKRGKNGNEVIGLSMLDEIRKELGPARVGIGAQRA